MNTRADRTLAGDTPKDARKDTSSQDRDQRSYRANARVGGRERGSDPRVADSSPGNPPDERKGTTPPDGTAGTSQGRDRSATVDAATAEPGRGQVPSADPRVDVATADSRPAPDGTTGSDRDTLKPGV